MSLRRAAGRCKVSVLKPRPAAYPEDRRTTSSQIGSIAAAGRATRRRPLIASLGSFDVRTVLKRSASMVMCCRAAAVRGDAHRLAGRRRSPCRGAEWEFAGFTSTRPPNHVQVGTSSPSTSRPNSVPRSMTSAVGVVTVKPRACLGT